MSASEKAETILLIAKRLLKWAAIALLTVMGGVGGILGYEHYQEFERNKPRQLTAYAGVALGDSVAQVRYALGDPESFFEATEKGASNEWIEFPRVFKVGDAESERLLTLSTEWRYSDQPTITSVGFDKAGGAVTAISCYSSSVYACPALLGLRDGDTEEDVLEHLGPPASASIENGRKTMRYPQYNLKLSLEQKKIFMLEVTRSAGER